MENITDSNFNDIISKETLPVIIDFWAEWCMPCKMMIPVLEDIAKDYNGKVRIMKMNIDENQEIPQKFGIISIPTLIIFKNGELMENIVGAVPKSEVVKVLKGYL